MPKEIWKTVPEYPLYKVSNQGRVKRTGKGNIQYPGEKILKPSKCGGTVYIGNKSRGNQRNLPIGYLVLTTFKGQPPLPWGKTKGCCVVRHLDDIRSHNKLTNLAWGTHKENTQDAIRNKRGWQFSKETRAKMSAAKKGGKLKPSTLRKLRAMRKDPTYRAALKGKKKPLGHGANTSKGLRKFFQEKRKRLGIPLKVYVD